MLRPSLPSAAALGLALAALAWAPPAAAGDDAPASLPARTNFLTGFPARNADGTINAVVEIPAGTDAKWEVAPSGESLDWEIQDGVRRVVQYLPYPANYGMVPRTLLPAALGGDGDPLDVVLLGGSIERGSVVPARVIGVLRLRDDGERDDKILATPLQGPFADIADLADLRARRPGVDAILETWFTHYKGPGRIEAQGFSERSEALRVVGEAARAFEERPRP
jgi:inorganic pyrophosphatase